MGPLVRGRTGRIERWRKTGDVEVFHYALEQQERLKFAFYEDAERYHPAARQLDLPMLVFQGRQDEAVSPAIVQRFSKRQRAATLHMLDDNHQLKNSLDFIWAEVARFLAVGK